MACFNEKTKSPAEGRFLRLFQAKDPNSNRIKQIKTARKLDLMQLAAPYDL